MHNDWQLPGLAFKQNCLIREGFPSRRSGDDFLVPEKKMKRKYCSSSAKSDPLAVAHARGVHAALDAQNEAERVVQATIAENAANAMQERLTARSRRPMAQDTMNIYDRMLERLMRRCNSGILDAILPDIFRSGPNKAFSTCCTAWFALSVEAIWSAKPI